MEKHIITDLKKGQIDIFLLWRVLQGNIIKIVVLAILLGGAVGLYRYTNAEPYYTAKIKFLVSGITLQTDKEGNVIGVLNNIGAQSTAVGSNIAYSAPYLIVEDKSVNEIIRYMNEQNPDTYSNLNRRTVRSMLAVEVDKQVVTVSISGADKKAVMDVAKAIQVKVPATLDYYFGIENTEGLENIASVAKAINDVYEDNLVHTGRNVSMYTALGAVIGALVVYLLCLFRTYFDNTVYNEEDLKNRFTIPVIGQIPTWENAKEGGKQFKDKSRKDFIKGNKGNKNPDGGNLMSDRDYDGRILNKKTPFAITEAFKLLRTNMCYTTKGEKCAVYGITSAYVSAGKSLIMANIAVSFAQMNKKVLLIDGDLRCPVQHKIFNLDNKVNGFSDLLAGICTYEDLYRRNGGIENLNIITSGKIPPNPAELLASPRLNEFMDTVKQEYDMIFIDLPPVCEVSDAGIISDLLTGYVFVVRSGYSDRRMIELAVETMEGFNASFVGFILNDIDIKSGDYYKNKYYSSYSKYRFRYGKSGYYRHFKYGYYKGYYSRYSRYSRYNSKYSRYGYNKSYGGYGASNYSRAHDEATAAAEAEEVADQQTAENLDVQEPAVSVNETPAVENAMTSEEPAVTAEETIATEEPAAQEATEEPTATFRNND